MDQNEPEADLYFDLYKLGYFYFGEAYLYFGPHLGLPPLGGGIRGGYSLWRYARGEWALQKDACDPGYESSPPQGPGGYEGEFRRTAARPRPRP